MKECLLRPGEPCTECGECDRCDLDETKICDNCCKCLQNEADYMEVQIDEIIEGSGEEQGSGKDSFVEADD